MLEVSDWLFFCCRLAQSGARTLYFDAREPWNANCLHHTDVAFSSFIQPIHLGPDPKHQCLGARCDRDFILSIDNCLSANLTVADTLGKTHGTKKSRTHLNAACCGRHRQACIVRQPDQLGAQQPHLVAFAMTT